MEIAQSPSSPMSLTPLYGSLASRNFCFHHQGLVLGFSLGSCPLGTPLLLPDLRGGEGRAGAGEQPRVSRQRSLCIKQEGFSCAANQSLWAERLQMKGLFKSFPLQMKLPLRHFFLFHTSSTPQVTRSPLLGSNPRRGAIWHISISVTGAW